MYVYDSVTNRTSTAKSPKYPGAPAAFAYTVKGIHHPEVRPSLSSLLPETKCDSCRSSARPISWSPVVLTAWKTSSAKAGYSRALLLLAIVPFIWSLPTAFMVGELASSIPDEGGFYVWVYRAMGPFWGFQEAWLSLAASVFDMAIYPVTFVLYLSRVAPSLTAGYRGNRLGARGRHRLYGLESQGRESRRPKRRSPIRGTHYTLRHPRCRRPLALAWPRHRCLVAAHLQHGHGRCARRHPLELHGLGQRLHRCARSR